MWAKLDDEIWMNPKFVGLRDNAQALWLRSLSLVGKLDTGGFLPKAYLPLVKATKNGIKQLVDAGLWETTDGGYDFHDWEKYNLTEREATERVTQRRKDKADRQARWREKQRIEAERAAQAEAEKQVHVDAGVDVYTAQNGVYKDAVSHAGARSEPVPVTRIGDSLREPPPPLPPPAEWMRNLPVVVVVNQRFWMDCWIIRRTAGSKGIHPVRRHPVKSFLWPSAVKPCLLPSCWPDFRPNTQNRHKTPEPYSPPRCRPFPFRTKPPISNRGFVASSRGRNPILFRPPETRFTRFRVRHRAATGANRTVTSTAAWCPR